MKKFLRIIAVLGVAAGLWLAPAWSQTTTGQITGTVADASGAVIPGASVTLTNVLTGQARTLSSNARGAFIFAQVLPGTYIVKISAPGFKTTTIPNIGVTVSQAVSLHKLTLQVGQQSQEVTTTAQAVGVQTETSAVSGLVTSNQLATIPNNGRNYLGTLQVLPGVSSNPFSTGAPTIQGGRQGQTLVQLDGVADTDNGVQNTGGNYTPNLDDIAEVRVMLSNYEAQYGARAGGLIQVTTKSGTDHYHGFVSEYFKNTSLDSRNAFSNTRGIDKYNNPDYGIGGPVKGPGSLFANNRLRFFWTQEWLPSSGGGTASFLRVPTLAERRGDFSNDVVAGSSSDPTLGVYPGDTGMVTAAPGKAAPITCPDGTAAPNSDVSGCAGYPINTAVQQYMDAILPLPNYCSDGSTVGNCTQNSANDSYITNSKTSENQESLRLDYALSANHSFFIRGIRDNHVSSTASDTSQTCVTDLAAGTTGKCAWPALPGANHTFSWGVVFTLVDAFGPNIANNLTIGGNINEQNFSPGSSAIAKFSRATTGLTAFPQFYPAANNLNLAPYATFNDGNFGSAPNFNNSDARYPFMGLQHNYNLNEDLSWIHGNMTFNVGAYIELGLRNSSRESYFNTSYNFGTDPSNPLDTGFSYANALLGVVGGSGFQESNKRLTDHGRYNNIDWFVQDDWQVSPRLTLNLGIRFQHITPTWSAGDTLSNFSTSKYQSLASTVDSVIVPACDNGGTYDTSPTSPCASGTRVGYNPNTQAAVVPALIGAYAPNAAGTYKGLVTYPGAYLSPVGKINVQQPGVGYGPRLGFAYDVFGNGKTALRGGFGIFYDRNVGDDIFTFMLAQPPNLYNYSVPDTTVGNLQALCTGTTCNPSGLYLSPVAINAIQTKYKMPQTENYSFGVQHDFGHGFTGDLSYQGNQAHHLYMLNNLNSVNYGAELSGSANYNSASVDPTTGKTVSGNYADLLRPYKGFGGITYASFNGNSNYNALEIQIKKRVGALSLNGSYTWSKVLDWGLRGFGGNSWPSFIPNQRLVYGPASGDHRQDLVINWNYRLPFSTGSAWLNEAVSGWQVSGLATFETGSPQTVSYSVPGVNVTGTLSEPPGFPPVPSLATSPSIAGVANDGASSTTNLQSRLNQKAIVLPAISTSTNPGSTPGLGNASLKDVFTGPGYDNYNISFFKTFNLGKSETRNLQIRVDTFNTFNHVQFSGVNTGARFSGSGAQTNSQFGYYNRANPARTMQVGLSLHF